MPSQGQICKSVKRSAGKERSRSFWPQYNLRPYFHLRPPPGCPRTFRTSWSDSRPKRCLRAQCGYRHQDRYILRPCPTRHAAPPASGTSSPEFTTFTRTIYDQPAINVRRRGEGRIRLLLNLTPKEMDIYDKRCWDSVVQVLFRVGEETGGKVTWDILPRQAFVYINRQLLVCTSSPLELSRFVELWPRQGDLPLTFTWDDVDCRPYRLRVDFIFIRSPHLFSDHLNVRPVHHFLRMLRQREADESRELVLLSEQVSLLCPMTLRRMACPVQGLGCRHLQCFDGPTYLQMNLQRPRWTCPLCRGLAYPDTLIRDQFTQNMLKECPADSALLTNSAEWTPQ